MPTTKKATKSKSAPAADPHADAKAKLAETLLAQHRAKQVKRAARAPARPAPAEAEPTTAAPPAAEAQPEQPTPEAKAAEPEVANPAETAAGARRGLPRQAAAPDTRTIKLLVDKNPRREGTGRHALFAIIMAHDGQTMAAALAGGATQAGIASAVRHEPGRARAASAPGSSRPPRMGDPAGRHATGRPAATASQCGTCLPPYGDTGRSPAARARA
jgi:hypothetical protein